jgi:transmembrane sensor
MTVHDRHDEPEPVEREAHRWVAQLVSGEATTTDAEALRQWRRQSPAHEETFAAAIKRWKNFGPAGKALLTEGKVPTWTPPEPMVGRRAMLSGMGVLAAGAASYAIVRPPLGLWPSLSELTADYRTATGEQRQVMLAENVAVRLNTQTSIAVASPVDGADEVKLIAGEASFAIPTDARRPFAVLAGNGRSVASRARFDVRNVGAKVYITCLDGEVQIEQGTEAATISARQQLHYDAHGLQSAINIDPAEAVAWQDGMLVFRLTPLSDVVAEINRYRPGRVVLMNPELGANPVNGRFRIQRIDEVLVWIEQAFGATTRALPGGIVLLS